MGEKHTRDRHITGQRMTGVILHPLAEVGVGMFMSVMIGRRQLVVNLQRGSEGRHGEQEARDEQRDHRAGFVAGTMTKHDHPSRQISKA